MFGVLQKLMFFSCWCFSCRFLADSQMNKACLLFADHHGAAIVEQNLQRNFLLHLISMHDFNLIGTQTINMAVTRLCLLQNQGARRHEDEEEEEEEEDWETAVESQPEPDPDISEFKTCADETGNSSRNNQPEEATAKTNSKQRVMGSVLK